MLVNQNTWDHDHRRVKSTVTYVRPRMRATLRPFLAPRNVLDILPKRLSL